MQLLSIASGSSGNSIFVSSEQTRVLVDAGISNKRIEEGLRGINLAGNDIDALLITHEHSDHIRGLGVLLRKYGLPVYATKGTIQAIMKDFTLGDFPTGLLNAIYPDDIFEIGDFRIRPFHTHHDAADPVGYRLSDGKKTVTISTDLGHYDSYIIDSLKESDALLIESNHDIKMLEAGPYPYYLKRRILSDYGHLSNENCGKLICEVMNTHLDHIILGHLSKENNYPELAYEAVQCEIKTHMDMIEGRRPSEINITVARRSSPGELITV